MVGFAVSRELWKLHERKNIKAHAALSFISDAIEHHKGRLLILTVKGEHIQYTKHAKNEVIAERVSSFANRIIFLMFLCPKKLETWFLD